MNDLIAGIVTVERIGQKLTSEQTSALENTLNGLLKEIRGCQTVEHADFYFDQLAQLQTELARACFKWDVLLSPILRRFVREFDRSDDLDLRQAVFKQIKDGTFLL